MTQKCFDDAALQAFADGELGASTREQITRHVAVCAKCAHLLTEIETETAFVFAALDGELNAPVPSERLRANIFAAIGKEKKPIWRRIFGSNFSFANPSFAAFAGLILVVAISLIVWNLRLASSVGTAKNELPKIAETLNDSGSRKTDSASTDETLQKDESAKTPENRRLEAVNFKRPRNSELISANFKQIQKIQTGKSRTLNVKNQLNAEHQNEISKARETISGEATYVKTIGALTDAVNQRKDDTLPPAARFDFEKNLAVVNDAIEKMQKEVRKNPSNEAAKNVLRASYQNKIDLLNSVAERSDLMASLH